MNMPFQPQQAKPPIPQQGGGGAVPSAPVPPQAGGGAAPAGAMPEEVRGAQRVSNTEFNQQMQNILLSRIEEEGQKNPNFGEAIDNGITNEAALELALILPELHPVFRAMGLFDGIGTGTAAIRPPAAAQGAPGQAPGGFPPGGGAPGGPSRGLMG